MSESGRIPTRLSPDVASLTVLVDGEEISGEFHVLSATISRELNRIPTASLHLRDGEAARETFPASDTEHFLPGREIEIRLGYRGDTESVFTGVVVRHSVRVRKNETRLDVELVDRAVRMTTVRRCRQFADMRDSDVLAELFAQHGVQADVASTQSTLPQVVQYGCSDWDFAVCRAEANGQVVRVRDGKATVAPPDVGARPVVAARFGATLLELDAEIDARRQPGGVTAQAWNPTDQELLETEASEPQVTDSGNLDAADLAGVVATDAEVLRHGGTLSEPELKAWADARLLLGRLAKVRGRARFQGFAGVDAGDVVDVTGIGKRFSGTQYVGGVRHTLTDGNWETDVAFGLGTGIHAEKYPVTPLPAGGLLAAVNGLQVGVVTALEGDPAGEDRIRVGLPMLGQADDGLWARLATLDAGDGRGTYVRPEVGDEVVVGFLDADPRFPVVLGQLHSSAKPAPVPGADDNHLKGYVSRSGITLGFDDEKVAVVVETPAGNRLTLSEDAETVSLSDQHGNTVVLDGAGITLESSKDLVLKAAGDLSLNGTKVEVAAQSTLKVGGQASVDINSSGTLTVKGSLVQIN